VGDIGARSARLGAEPSTQRAPAEDETERADTLLAPRHVGEASTFDRRTDKVR
jgi:hypothetical protein